MAAGELTLRWAVAILGIPVVLGLLYVGGWVLAVPVAGLAALGTHECYRLAAQRENRPIGWLGVSASAALVLAAAWRPTFMEFSAVALGILGAVVGIALVIGTFWRGAGGRPMGAVSVTLLGVAYVGLALACVPLLHALPADRSWGGAASDPWVGVLVVSLPLVSTWVGDASAFFAGKAWGHKRLAPEISPNKSWVGAWAGVLGASAGAMVWFLVGEARLARMAVGNVGTAAAIGALLGVGAILGDLVESTLKREAGVKDSGAVFPGHGGALDRLDALIFTLPLAYALLLLLDAFG